MDKVWTKPDSHRIEEVFNEHSYAFMKQKKLAY